MEVTVSDLFLFCQYFNIIVVFIVDFVKEDNIICIFEIRFGKVLVVDEDLVRKKFFNYICRFMKSTNNCVYIFLRLETDVKRKFERRLEGMGEFWYLYKNIKKEL